ARRPPRHPRRRTYATIHPQVPGSAGSGRRVPAHTRHCRYRKDSPVPRLSSRLWPRPHGSVYTPPPGRCSLRGAREDPGPLTSERRRDNMRLAGAKSSRRRADGNGSDQRFGNEYVSASVIRVSLTVLGSSNVSPESVRNESFTSNGLPSAIVATSARRPKLRVARYCTPIEVVPPHRKCVASVLRISSSSSSSRLHQVPVIPAAT